MKIKNDELDKYPKTCNSLNLSIIFCSVSNKSKNTILFLFSDFSLSHTFYLFSYESPSLNLPLRMLYLSRRLGSPWLSMWVPWQRVRVVWTVAIPFLLIISFFYC